MSQLLVNYDSYPQQPAIRKTFYHTDIIIVIYCQLLLTIV